MKIPELSIECTNDGLIELEQQNSLDEPDRIQIHPLHLRHMAESLGLVREMSASEADALRMVDKLARRLKVLHERITQMDRWLWEHPDHENADISTEIWYSAATMELSTEFQAEIEESRAVVTPRRADFSDSVRDASRTERDKSRTEIRPLQHTQKRDASSTAPSTPAQKELLA
ncbi:hypothetical protein [Variovorax boronicumulans]|uniref:hypothetical protein n=1 Tax=Variovorax boronicumulans TaxID=436515 RepID=UPI003390C5BE